MLDDVQIIIYNLGGTIEKMKNVNRIASGENVNLNLNVFNEGVFIVEIRTPKNSLYRSKFIIVK